jgi:hypothetical protein
MVLSVLSQPNAPDVNIAHLHFLTLNPFSSVSLKQIINRSMPQNRAVICWWPSPAHAFLVSDYVGARPNFCLLQDHLTYFEMGTPLRREEGFWLTVDCHTFSSLEDYPNGPCGTDVLCIKNVISYAFWGLCEHGYEPSGVSQDPRNVSTSLATVRYSRSRLKRSAFRRISVCSLWCASRREGGLSPYNWLRRVLYQFAARGPECRQRGDETIGKWYGVCPQVEEAVCCIVSQQQETSQLSDRSRVLIPQTALQKEN